VLRLHGILICFSSRKWVGINSSIFFFFNFILLRCGFLFTFLVNFFDLSPASTLNLFLVVSFTSLCEKCRKFKRKKKKKNCNLLYINTDDLQAIQFCLFDPTSYILCQEQQADSV
jgi:hypothetical protein